MELLAPQVEAGFSEQLVRVAVRGTTEFVGTGASRFVLKHARREPCAILKVYPLLDLRFSHSRCDMSGPPVMKSWLNWGEVSEKAGTIDELRALLGKYSPTSVLVACSQISVHLNYGPEGKTTPSDELTTKYIPFLFPPSLVQRVKKAHELGRVIFFQGQLRSIAAEVTRLSPMPDESLPAIENHELGELMLRAAELLMAVHPKPTDPMDALANLAVQWVPFYELDSPTDPFTQLMRIYIMLTVNIPRLAAKGPLAFDVAAEFEKVFGFPLKLYIDFMFLIMMHATIQRDELQLKNQMVNSMGPLYGLRPRT